MKLIQLYNAFKEIIINPIKEYHYNLKEYIYLKKLVKSVKRTEILKNNTVVINVIRGIRNNIDIDIFFRLIFALNGANIKIFDSAKMIKPEVIEIGIFQRLCLDYNNEYVKYYYNLSLKNAILCRSVGEYILNNIKPDLFLTSHAMYSTHGPTFEFLKKMG